MPGDNPLGRGNSMENFDPTQQYGAYLDYLHDTEIDRLRVERAINQQISEKVPQEYQKMVTIKYERNPIYGGFTISWKYTPALAMPQSNAR
jgi:hypothetical protein